MNCDDDKMNSVSVMYFPAKGDRTRVLLPFLYLAIMLAFGSFYAKTFYVGLALAAVLLITPVFIKHHQFLPAMLIAYFTIVPTYHVSSQFEGLPIYFFYPAIPFFLTAAILLFSIERHFSYEIPALPEKNEATGIFVQLLILWFVFNVIRGIAANNNPDGIYSDSIQAFAFVSYFYWRKLFRNKYNLKKWFIYLLILSPVVSLVYVYLFMQSYENIIAYVLERKVTYHAYYSVVAVPLAISYFMISKNKLYKVLLMLLVLLAAVQLVLSQQRVTWVALIVMLVVYATLYSFRKGFTFNTLSHWIVTVFGSLAVLVGLFMLGASYFGLDLELALSRWDKLASFTDKSLLMRYFDSLRAINLLQGDWLWGLGVGTQIRAAYNLRLSGFIDQSYVLALYTGGAIMLFLLLGVYLSALSKSLQAMIKTDRESEKLMAIAIATSILGTMSLAMTDVQVYLFAFLTLWMLMLAAAVVLNEHIDARLAMNDNVERVSTEDVEEYPV